MGRPHANRRTKPLPRMIPLTRLRPILQREIDKRADEKGRGGAAMLCAELAAWSGRPKAVFSRRLYSIMHGRDGSSVIDGVHFDTADRFLTGLDLTDLWYTELADLFDD